MKKVILEVIIFICLFTININVFALDTYSSNVIMYNMNDDKVIYEKDSNDIVKIASLTKIMTAIVALENISDIDLEVIMPSNAYVDLSGYVTSGIKAFDRVTYRDLLYGLMLPSGADCANAIAILTTGSVSNFVDKMNEKAKELGLINTHFSNPIGKDLDNYSTVSDLAIILKYALKNDDFYEIFTTKEYTTTNNIVFKSTLVTKSKSLDVSNILGSKTGFTDLALNCLASISKINNVKYLLVTVGASTSGPYQFIDAINLYDYYSSNYSYKRVLKFDQLIETIKVKSVFDSDYNIKSDSDLYLYLSNDVNLDDIEYDYNGVLFIDNKMDKGDFLGYVDIKYNGEVLSTYNVYLDIEVSNYDYLIILVPIFVLFTLSYIVFLFLKRKKVQYEV